MTRPLTIDVHAHVVPRSCLGLIAARPESANLIGDMSDLDRRLSDMEAMRIDRQVVSAWQGFFNQPPAIAARFNDALAAYVADAPQRLAGMAVSPLGEPAAAVAELERCRALGLKGVAIGSNVDGQPLDSPAFRAFFEAASELALPIFIHPTGPFGADRLREYELLNLLGFVSETALAAARLALSGLLEALPTLRIHLAHGGGSAPWLAGRWDHGWRERPAAGGTLLPPSTMLKRLHVDTIVHQDANLRFLRDFCGSGRIMLGTDYPYNMGMPDAVGWIEGCDFLSETEKADILGGTAQRLFGWPG